MVDYVKDHPRPDPVHCLAASGSGRGCHEPPGQAWGCWRALRGVIDERVAGRFFRGILFSPCFHWVRVSSMSVSSTRTDFENDTTRTKNNLKRLFLLIYIKKKARFSRTRPSILDSSTGFPAVPVCAGVLPDPPWSASTSAGDPHRPRPRNRGRPPWVHARCCPGVRVPPGLPDSP